MGKYQLLILILAGFFLFNSTTANGQVYQMADGVINTCNGTFTDPGGLDADYGPNQNITATFCSSGISTEGTHIQMIFSGVALGAGETLCFYDGLSADPDSLITCAADFLALGATDFVVQATAANLTGCLTIQFISDATDEDVGWTAAINCTVACQIFQANVISNSHPIIPVDTGYIDICQGERVAFSANGVYGQNDVVYHQSDLTSTFEWTFDDGGTAVGPNVSHIFTNPYGHVVSVVIRDERGCTNSNFISQRVRVSPDPVFFIGEDIDSLVCLGDTITLTGAINAINGSDVSAIPGSGEFIERGIVSDSIPLPDGDGASYETPINFETFSPGQVLTNINDLESICVTMEHSWLRDLEISIICPDGTEVILHNHPGQFGNGVFCGEPIVGDNVVTPGVGYTYCWTPEATDTWIETVNADPSITTLPPGDYGTYEPLSDLVGCPLNGEWILRIFDNWPGDNGYIFSWNINFNSAIYPSVESYSPALIDHEWIDSDLINFYSQDSIVSIPESAGISSFTYLVTDDFGCAYRKTVDVDILPKTHPDCHSCGEYISEPEDATICSGETAFLDVSTNINLMDEVTFTSRPGIPFGFTTNPPIAPLYVSLDVNSVAPTVMNDPFGMIKSVCIDIESPPQGNIGDLSIFLIAPSGERMELTTENGGAGSDYNNTCFSPIAFTNIINAAPPFTGTFAPEGNWADLQNANVIGEWQLELTDRFGPNPVDLSTLVSWSITFNSTNSLTYNWEPDNGTLSCTDCPDPFAIPLGTTDYISTTTDQYGCIYMDTVTVFIVDSIPAPELICQTLGNGEIQFSWPVVAGINNYDINIFENGVGQGWQMLGDQNEYVFSGLSFEDVSEMAVRVHTDGVSQNCGIMIDTLKCIYTECSIADSLMLDSIRIVNTSCNGLSDGEAEVFLANGHAPISYNWNDPQEQVEQGAYFLSAGHYEVTITDSIFCQLVVPVDIVEPTPLLSTVQGTDVLCRGDSTGVGEVSANGGTMPYSFEWDDGITDSSTSTLNAGMHFVTITDNNNCLYVDTLIINEPAEQLSATYEQTYFGCNGESGNKAMVTASGGTGSNYQFTWSNGQSGAIGENLPAGLSQLIVTDENMCQFTMEVDLVDLDTLYAAFLVVEPSCFNTSDGLLSANVYGGGAGQDGVESDYTFSWSSGDVGVAAVNVPGGQYYFLTLTDSQGCSTVVSRKLDNPDPITFDVSMAQEPSCQSAHDGVAEVLNIAGVQGDYLIQWDENAASQQGLSANNLSAGTYQVTVSDEKNCQLSKEVLVTEPPKLEVAYSTKDNVCFGDALGSIDVLVSGGHPDYSYQWSNNGSGTHQDHLPAGIYELRINDKNGCEESLSIEIKEPDPLLVSFETDSVSCFGKKDGRITAIPMGGNPPFRYSLDNENFLGTGSLLGLEAGDYNIYIYDAGGCRFIGDATVGSPDEFIVDGGGNQTIILGDTITITAESQNGQGNVSYVWYPPYEGINSCTECQMSDFYPQTTAIYELYAVDENGCESTDFITINVEKPRLAVVPTGFTPNGDQVNDLLLVHGIPGTKVLSFRVFDRWGELVYQASNFEVNDPVTGWDGTFKNKDLASGVYIWYLEVEYPFDKRTGQFTGETSLIR